MHMKKEYDFSKAKRGVVESTTGKTRITLYLDNDVLDHFRTLSEQTGHDVLDHFRTLSEQTGRGYQTLVNEALKVQVGLTEQPLTPEAVRRIVREELALQS